VLAQGQQGKDVIEYEGNLYFVPGSVNQQVLRVTDRTYTCPYKRMCNWVDHAAHDGSLVRDVAWSYPQVKLGHAVIQGRFGFNAGTRGTSRPERARTSIAGSAPAERRNLSFFPQSGKRYVILMLTSRARGPGRLGPPGRLAESGLN